MPLLRISQVRIVYTAGKMRGQPSGVVMALPHDERMSRSMKGVQLDVNRVGRNKYRMSTKVRRLAGANDGIWLLAREEGSGRQVFMNEFTCRAFVARGRSP